MKLSKKVLAAFMAAGMIFGMAACGGGGTSTGSSAAGSSAAGSSAAGSAAAGSSAAGSGDKILKAAASFAYASLDVHKESYGWYTSIYGVSESLFKVDDNSKVVSCLAKDAVAEGNKWTITLNDGVAFSNGNKLTAEIVIKNLKRAAEVNKKYAKYADYKMEAKDEKTVVIDTGDKPVPTMKNDLADVTLGMIDIDNTKDFDNNPICTGPFVIKEFKPKGDVTVAKNEKYWGGSVALDGAVFYYMQEDDPKLLAMQSGELDCYNSVSADAMAVYQKEPDKYKVVSIQGSRLQFYILNQKLDAKVREAINLTVDKDAMAEFLKGSVSPATSPFASTTAYSKVNIPKVDTAKAKSLIEEAGYKLGSDGIYEKGGQKLKLKVCYYAARSLDKLAVLMQEQLKAIGIDCELKVEEDADATYIKTKDYDIAWYCMISDKTGDPQYFIDTTLAKDSNYNGGFTNAEMDKLIEELHSETDSAKRAELANKIIQIAIDGNAFGYTGIFNHTTVLKPGVSGFAENSPYDFYGIDAKTTK
ncbi:MAG: ABC transporter substrate-binding protein [Lachnospiraceae bacterium]|nr:ABC transporter substrate-binding protein [Lachnospiraceae bacterium]